MRKAELSDIVQTTAGRDKERLFVVVRVEPGFLYLADGKKRRISAPKRKKPMHTRFVQKGTEDFAVRLLTPSSDTDSAIRKTLSAYRRHEEGGFRR